MHLQLLNRHDEQRGEERNCMFFMKGGVPPPCLRHISGSLRYEHTLRDRVCLIPGLSESFHFPCLGIFFIRHAGLISPAGSKFLLLSFYGKICIDPKQGGDDSGYPPKLPVDFLSRRKRGD